MATQDSSELDDEARAAQLGQLLTEAVLLLVPQANLLNLAGISKKLAKAAERVGKFSPKNVKLLNEAFLKQHGINAHALKSSWVGESNMSKFNIYRHTQTGELILLQHKGKGVPIPTGKFIN